MDLKPTKVLISAYACLQDPSTSLPGGGDLMAWNVIRQLRERHELWVLTAVQNRRAIEAELEKDPMPGVHFVYVGLPGWLYGLNRAQGGYPVLRLPVAVAGVFCRPAIAQENPF